MGKSGDRHKRINQLELTDKLLYDMGLVALGIYIVSVLLYVSTGFSILELGVKCMFLKYTGYPCPGCGGTRSLHALYRGDILGSLYNYPPLLYGIVVYFVFMIRCFLYRRFGVKKSKDGTVLKYIYIFAALIFLQWFVKIAAQMFFGYYWLL